MEKFSKHTETLRKAYRAAYLVCGFIRKDLTIAEEEELDNWMLASEDNMQLFEDLTDEKTIPFFLKWQDERDIEAKLKEVKKKMRFKNKPGVVVFWRYAAAACIMALLGFSLYWLSLQEKVSIAEPLVSGKQDIQPGSALATLKIGEDKVIVLGHQEDSVINKQVRLKNGEVVYSNNDEPVSMHELSIPRKGYYRLLLPDGTKVWLNAESSIKYPSAFSDSERHVEVTGETFFEVAKNPAKPFVVTVNGISITALGTAFNINSYANEPELQTTLVEGSIKVKGSDREQILKPLQQIRISKEKWKILDKVPVNTITGWVHDEFSFKNTSIREIMRMLQRWYDVGIKYEDPVNFHFNGRIERNYPLSKVLHLLEKTGQVHFRTEGTLIIVGR